jgi:flagellin-specific chaperone FliS
MAEGTELKPTIGRANQDKMGRALRAMYEDLLHQLLPENLTAPLRAIGEVQSSRARLEQALQAMRRVSPSATTTPSPPMPHTPREIDAA